MRYIELKKISSAEAFKIDAAITGILLLGYAATKLQYFDYLRYLYSWTGLISHPTSACIFLNVAGIPCPFCGMSRSLGEMMNLNLIGSFYYNPSAFFVISAAAIVLAAMIVLSFLKYKISVNMTGRLWVLSFFILSVIWILNIIYGHQ